MTDEQLAALREIAEGGMNRDELYTTAEHDAAYTLAVIEEKYDIAFEESDCCRLAADFADEVLRVIDDMLKDGVAAAELWKDSSGYGPFELVGEGQ